MRSKILVTAILLTSLCYAKEPKHYQTGTLLQMDSVACGVDEKDGKSLAGEMLGTDSGHKKSRELLCQEYLLQSEHVIYRIRPRDDKHPVLLPVGERAQFRIQVPHPKRQDAVAGGGSRPERTRIQRRLHDPPRIK